MPGWRLIVVSEREHGFVDLPEAGSAAVGLGRAPDNDIVIKDDMASRKHAVIERDAEGTFRVRDLKSFNGTYLNERRIKDEPLGPWDAVRVGRTKVFLVERGEAAPPAPVVGAALPPAPGPSAPGAPADGDGPPEANATRTMDVSEGGLLASREVRRVIDDLVRREREEVERETVRRLRDESAPAVLASIDGLVARARRFGSIDGGGDFYDVFTDPGAPGDLLVALGSVSGVGVAACVAACVARHGLRGVVAARAGTPREHVDTARELLARTLHPGSAVSLLLARVTPQGLVRVATTGGTGVAHYHAATEVIEVVRPPARRDEEAPRTVEHDATLKLEDRLLLLSDGAGSLRRPSDQQPLGADRVREAFGAAALDGPKELLAQVAEAFERHAEGAPDRDASAVVVALAR